MNPNLEISNAFNAQAFHYEEVAAVQQEIGERLFERLDYLKINPRMVLDVGCGPGVFTKRLQARYPKAQVIGVDLAKNMLLMAKKKQGWFSPWGLVQADMLNLPFGSGQCDLIFANQVVHWSKSQKAIMQEFQRVLSSSGCLMFSTLGPDTFQELRDAFQSVDTYAHVNAFDDMHDVGDCLLQQGFADPVVDMEKLKAQYPSTKALLNSLKAQGVKNINPNRRHGLMGKTQWQQFLQAMQPNQDHKFLLTYEVIYGHAWKGFVKGESVFTLDDLKRTLPSNRE